MSGRGWRRRSVLGLGLLGPSIPLLAACAPSRTDPGTPTPQPADPSPECIDLAEHEFRRGRTYCGDPGDSDGADGDMAPTDFRGPIVATDDTITAWYVDAVAQWSIAEGEMTRLAAPKRADGWSYAHRGETTVVPRCDGTLLVHTDGCGVAELSGHAPADDFPRDGIEGVVFVDDSRLVSLGRDDTLRLWDLATADSVVVRELDSSGAGRFLGFDPASGLVTVSGADWLSAFRLDQLDPVDHFDGLPRALSGWLRTPDGTLAGIEREPSSIVFLHPATGATERIEVNDPPKALAVAPSGTVAAVQGIHLHLRAPDGTIQRIRLERSSYHTGGIAFSPDEQSLHVLDAVEGIQTVRIDDGAQLTRYTQPNV